MPKVIHPIPHSLSSLKQQYQADLKDLKQQAPELFAILAKHPEWKDISPQELHEIVENHKQGRSQNSKLFTAALFVPGLLPVLYFNKEIAEVGETIRNTIKRTVMPKVRAALTFAKSAPHPIAEIAQGAFLGIAAPIIIPTIISLEVGRALGQSILPKLRQVIARFDSHSSDLRDAKQLTALRREHAEVLQEIKDIEKNIKVIDGQMAELDKFVAQTSHKQKSEPVASVASVASVAAEQKKPSPFTRMSLFLFGKKAPQKKASTNEREPLLSEYHNSSVATSSVASQSASATAKTAPQQIASKDSLVAAPTLPFFPAIPAADPSKKDEEKKSADHRQYAY